MVLYFFFRCGLFFFRKYFFLAKKIFRAKKKYSDFFFLRAVFFFSANAANSIAFGKSTSQRIYPEQHTPKIGWKLHKYGLKHVLHTLDDHFR